MTQEPEEFKNAENNKDHKTLSHPQWKSEMIDRFLLLLTQRTPIG